MPELSENLEGRPLIYFLLEFHFIWGHFGIWKQKYLNGLFRTRKKVKWILWKIKNTQQPTSLFSPFFFGYLQPPSLVLCSCYCYFFISNPLLLFLQFFTLLLSFLFFTVQVCVFECLFCWFSTCAQRAKMYFPLSYVFAVVMFRD